MKRRYKIPITILSSQIKELVTKKNLILILNSKKEKIQFKEIDSEESNKKLDIIFQIDALSLIFLGKEKEGLLKREEFLVLDFNTGKLSEEIVDSNIKEIMIKPTNLNEITVDLLDELIITFVKRTTEKRKTREEKIPYNLLDLKQFQQGLHNIVEISASGISKVYNVGKISAKKITETGARTIDSGIKLVSPNKKKTKREEEHAEVPVEDLVGISGKKWRKKEILFFIPGIGESNNTFNDIFEQTREDYQIVSYDLLGMPNNPTSSKKIKLDSIIENIHDAIIFSGKKDIILVSHSLGGYFALNYVDRYPDLIKGIILISYPGELDSNIRRMLSLVPPKILWRPLKGKAIKAGMNALFENKDTPQAKEIVKEAKKIPDSVTEKYIKILKSDGKDIISKINKPILIMLGRKDIVFQDISDSIRNKDNVSFIKIQSGHMMHIERSSEIKEKIDDWCGNL